MPSFSITTVTGCFLKVSGSEYIVNTFNLGLMVNDIPTMTCSIVIGQSISGNGLSYNTQQLLAVKAGTEAEVYLTGKYNGSDFTLNLLKGYITGLSVGATSGGGAQSSVSYSVQISLIHISGALNAYTIGNRVFLPKGQTREPFFNNIPHTANAVNYSVDIEGVDPLDVAEYFIAVVRKFAIWNMRGLPNAPKLPNMAFAPCKLNIQQVSKAANDVAVKAFIRDTVVSNIFRAQNGGTFFSLLQSLCSTFMLQVLPEYNGLAISPVLPVFKFNTAKCIEFDMQYVTGISSSNGMSQILPYDAIWVPNDKHPEYIARQADPKQAMLYNPLVNTMSQPHPEYFKYPTVANRTNGQIMEPPEICKKLLLGETYCGPPKEDTAESKSKTITAPPNNKKDTKLTKDHTDLNNRIGILSAKLLYCMHAFTENSVNLTFDIAALSSGYLAGKCKDPIYGPLGKIIKFKVIDNTGTQITQVGYCAAISIGLSQPSNAFGFTLQLKNVRSEEEDNLTSLDMNEPLIYQEIGNP